MSQFLLPKRLNSIFISWLSDCVWLYVWSGGEDVSQVCTTSRAHYFCCQRLEWHFSQTAQWPSLLLFWTPPHQPQPLGWLNSVVFGQQFKDQTLYGHSCGMHWQRTHTVNTHAYSRRQTHLSNVQTSMHRRDVSLMFTLTASNSPGRCQSCSVLQLYFIATDHFNGSIKLSDKSLDV